MSVTTLDDNAPGLEWAGTWKRIVQSDAYGGSVQAATDRGATMRYTFDSGSVAIYGTVPACSGSVGADIYVDNQIQVSQRFRCGFYSQSGVQFFESIPLAPSNGAQHVIQVTNSGAAPLYLDRLDIAGFEPGQTPSFNPGNPPPTPSPSRSVIPSSQTPGSSPTPTAVDSSSNAISPGTTFSGTSSSRTVSPTSSSSVTPSTILTTSDGMITTILVYPSVTVNGAGTQITPTLDGTPNGLTKLHAIVVGLATTLGILVLCAFLFLLRRRRRQNLARAATSSAHQETSSSVRPFRPYEQSSPDVEGAFSQHAVEASITQIKASIFPAEKMPSAPETTEAQVWAPCPTTFAIADPQAHVQSATDLLLEENRIEMTSDVPPSYDSVRRRSNTGS
ncbi:hypothetical protein CVT24_011948 [Panaeolus cyanescens]|uniref:Uncharacterized protein n=1 Tax=Panaeolus cyanescens TaxID=181874 RepID=A0A409W5T8_9AGAR|nr:hypothetical protein CVT24_011948 [Panaeolus cyanescens]